ncbi:MAG TPA: FAD-dependent oxidoreductase [Egibacteraceae bacterium]|nr:FAD-dependent oxidoreductase [Egibacteraceae bacterium]
MTPSRRPAPAGGGAGSLAGADVVVVGAGPAGAAAAIWCARQRLRVVLVDRAPGPVERPGESLHPGVDPPLAQLGVAERVRVAGFPRHRGHWVDWDAPAAFAAYGADAAGPWEGCQAHRATLDAILVQRAAEVGVDVRRPLRPVRPLLQAGRVAGVDTPEGALRAAVVVDASGGGHWLARRLGLAVVRCSPRLVARYGYARGRLPQRDDAPALRADSTGWTWTARVAPGRYHWTRLALHPGPDAAAVPEELRGLAHEAAARGADVTWRLVPGCAGPGYFLAGDAAAVLDPACSHGVLRALLSGMYAAHLIARVGADPSRQGVAASAYRTWMRRWFHHDAAALRKMYATLPCPPGWVLDGGTSTSDVPNNSAVEVLP